MITILADTFIFKELLHACMEVADVRRRLHDHLAVNHQLQTEYAVRRGCCGPIEIVIANPAEDQRRRIVAAG